MRNLGLGGGGNRIGLCSDSFTLSKIGLKGGKGRDEATKVARARFREIR